ncbi:type II toxin-antitoxin system RelB/DinJ family antitoxin [Gardnerella sp. DNF01204]
MVNVRIQENIKQQAEQILETIGIPRATAIDMFYRQIILNNGIPFSLTIPKSLPAQDDMDEKTFNALMAKGYDQAVQGDSCPIDDVLRSLNADWQPWGKLGFRKLNFLTIAFPIVKKCTQYP